MLSNTKVNNLVNEKFSSQSKMNILERTNRLTTCAIYSDGYRRSGCRTGLAAANVEHLLRLHDMSDGALLAEHAAAVMSGLLLYVELEFAL